MQTGMHAHRNRGNHPGQPVGICLCLLFVFVPNFHFSWFYHARDVFQGSVRLHKQKASLPWGCNQLKLLEKEGSRTGEKCAQQFCALVPFLSLATIFFVFQKCWKDGCSNFIHCSLHLEKEMLHVLSQCFSYTTSMLLQQRWSVEQIAAIHVNCQSSRHVAPSSGVIFDLSNTSANTFPLASAALFFFYQILAYMLNQDGEHKKHVAIVSMLAC